MTDAFEETFQQVVRMHLKDVGPREELPMEVSLVKLGLDSLSAVNLVLDLEETFQVEFPDTMLTEAVFATGETLRGGLRAIVAQQRGAAS